MMTEDRTYNEWTNYETWAVALWMDNAADSYNAAREIVRDAIEGNDESDPMARTNQGNAADALESWIEDMRPDLGASMWADLLNAALSKVNWYEIAENISES